MTKFQLPVGALIEINEKRYQYLGQGQFQGLTEVDIPCLIEGNVYSEDFKCEEIKLEPADDLPEHGYRVVWQCSSVPSQHP